MAIPQQTNSTNNGTQNDQSLAINATRKQNISTREVLDVFPALISVLLAGFSAAVRGIVGRDEHQAKTWHLHIGYAIMRKATRRFSILQFQLVSPSTDRTYKLWALLARKPSRSVNLNHGAKGHWLGNPNAKNVLVYYHGGGFALPANPAYFQFLSELLRNINSPKDGKKGDLAIFFLSYSLTPHAVYPTQLTQAVECLRYILSTGRRPADIYTAGDSAGGNLVVGVLSHLHKAHPAIEPLSIEEPLGGSILVSPWLLLNTDFTGHTIDHRGDIITKHVAAPWAGAYLTGRARDNYTDILLADEDWFRGIGEKTRRVLVLGGQNEILLPIIGEFAKRLSAVHPSLELVVGNRECHVAPVYNRLVFSHAYTEQETRAYSWLRDALSYDREHIPKLDKQHQEEQNGGLKEKVDTSSPPTPKPVPQDLNKENVDMHKNAESKEIESSSPPPPPPPPHPLSVQEGSEDTNALDKEPLQPVQPVQRQPGQSVQSEPDNKGKEVDQDIESTKSKGSRKSKKSKSKEKGSKEAIKVQNIPIQN